MSYQGQAGDIRVGQGGLLTDQTQTQIPDINLIRAENVDIRNGIIQKDFGARKWNLTTLGSPILALHNFYPNAWTNYFVLYAGNGKLYRYDDPETVREITATGSNPLTQIYHDMHPIIVEAGAESQGRQKKLFVFSGNSQVQVISGDSIVRRNISVPAADWSVSYPRAGVFHRGRLFAWGNKNDPHRVYASNVQDHEDFVTDILTFAVHPGDGEGISGGFVYKGKLFLFKRPLGLFVLVDEDADSDNWYFKKLSGEFGSSGHLQCVQALDDMIFLDSNAALISSAATDNFGDVQSGNIFSLLKIQQSIREQISPENLSDLRAIYHADRQIAYFTCRAIDSQAINRTIKLDMSKSRPEITLDTRNQINCFALRQTPRGRIPFYGSNDGFIYEMDRPDRDVGTTAFKGLFQTPHMDFSGSDGTMKGLNKVFDFVDIEFYPTGEFDTLISYYIDGVFVETISFRPYRGRTLGEFVLGLDRLGGNSSFYVRKRLRGFGKTISFKVENSGDRENFQISNLRVYFRGANQNQKSYKTGRV